MPPTFHVERHDMARNVKPRQNYLKDAIALRRTAEAVEADKNAPAEWISAVRGHLHAAMRLMLERDAANGQPQQDAS